MSDVSAEVLHTTAGDMPLEEVQLDVDGRTWSILHTCAVITRAEEDAFLLGENTTKRPYGIVLWPAAIALAHEVASRALAGARVLELGAGTGLPGIVAASLGARVVQTDRQKLALHVCKLNGARNGVSTIEHRIADWTEWRDAERYDVILGSDILYAEPLHPHLRRIFDANLAPGGTVLLSDPFRSTSVRLLEAMEAAGWRVAMDKWTVGVVPPPRAVGRVRADAQRVLIGSSAQRERAPVALSSSPSHRRRERARGTTAATLRREVCMTRAGELAVIAVVASAVGARAAHAEPERGNAIYVEALGRAGLWGVGIDHYFHPRWLVGIVGGGGNFEDQRYLSITPYVGFDIVRGGRSAWFIDGGAQLARTWNTSPVPEWSGTSSTGIGGTFSSGYEFRGRLLLRLFVLAAFGKGGLLPWAGADIGVTF